VDGQQHCGVPRHLPSCQNFVSGIYKGQTRTEGLCDCDDSDPLRDVVLASFGGYPTGEEIGKDYPELVLKSLRGNRVHIGSDDALPLDAFKHLTPSAISAFGVDSFGSANRDNPGVYVGSASDFDDLVSFWNLRAATIKLHFYDPAHHDRLRPLRDEYIELLRTRPSDPGGWREGIALWTRIRNRDKELEEINATISSLPESARSKIHFSRVSDDIWNGLNVTPPRMFLGDGQPVLASSSEDGSSHSFSFVLPKKPFYEGSDTREQIAIVSVTSFSSRGEESTFQYPDIPELNVYFGRQIHFGWNGLRAEDSGIGIVSSVGQHHLTVSALPVRQLMSKIFETFGMKAEQSEAGRVAVRMISQMGGLQGCRVFKIPGVRQLMETFGPLQSFTRSNAVQTIGQNDPVTGFPNFKEYETLYIEQRERRKLVPEDALNYLLKKNVFRVGLNLTCPICELQFWVQLDNVKSELDCELCGRSFNITPQLRDRDWAYRRSGLFGREDHQLGSIPVAITLQQLDTTIDDLIYTTGMNLLPTSADIRTCETDFVAISAKNHTRDGRVQIAVGEVKSHDEISEQDVKNLSGVVDAFPRHRFDGYIVFSKLSAFSPAEISRCRGAQEQYRKRVILLSSRELEPYFVYERSGKEFDIRTAAIAFDDLAQATHDIYFDPRLPQKSTTQGNITSSG
jgi:hypothetical protein